MADGGGAQAAPAPASGVSAWWRVCAIAALIALAVATATIFSVMAQFESQMHHVQTQLKETPRIKYIAVLQDSNQAPALLATLALQDDALELQRLNAVTEGREDSMQLWALSEGDPTRSLGVLHSSGKTLRLPVTERDLASATSLAISVEDKGGAAPGHGPRLPFLFKGSVVRKAL